MEASEGVILLRAPYPSTPTHWPSFWCRGLKVSWHLSTGDGALI